MEIQPAKNENKTGYRPDNYDPVSIGTLVKERFEILSKIDADNRSTTWLANDTFDERDDPLVMLHIFSVHVTNLNKHIVFGEHDPELGYASSVVESQQVFFIAGPNEKDHLCFVWPSTCPLLSRSKLPLPIRDARKVGFSVAKALKELHMDESYYHAGVNIYNVVYRMKKDLHQCTTEEIHQLCGESDGANTKVPAFPYKTPDCKALYEKFADTTKPGLVVKEDLVSPDGPGNQPEGEPADALLTSELQTIVNDCHGQPVDMWDFGCLLVQLLTGKRLEELLEQDYQIRYGNMDDALRSTPLFGVKEEDMAPYLKDIVDNIVQPESPDDNQKLYSLLRKIFVYERKNRITFEELVGDPWYHGESNDKYNYEDDDGSGYEREDEDEIMLDE